MRVVIAPDKFKGSLSAPDAAAAMACGVLRARPSAAIDRAPVADGGEGTVEALVGATGGTYREVIARGPMGGPVLARFGVLGDRRTAAIAMAEASGLALVPPDRRDPERASTLGTGDLIRAAIEAGCRRLIVGIGGSATNDGGAGMARSLGFRLLDADGVEIEPTGGGLDRLDRIEPPASGLPAGLDVLVACDVGNPLCGPAGASAVYGPQKGADPGAVARLDRNLARLARIIERDLGVAVADLPGAGAAGGLGAGLVAFLGGRLVSGVDVVIEAIGLEDRLRGADLALTGEGCLDGSTASGKAAVGVARLARRLGVPCLALAGTIGPGAESCLVEGVDAYFSICPGPAPLGLAIDRADAWLATAAEQAARAFLAGRGGRHAR